MSQAEQLHRKILVFSISHDHSTVKIYGHYALIKDRTTFHRHLIRSFDLIDYDGQNRWTAYNFVRKAYDHFAPICLKRIRDAVALLRPVGIEDSSELANSQETTASAPASQNTGNFKKPKVPPKKKWQQEIDKKDEQNNQLISQIAMLQQELKRQREEAKQREDQLREENERQLALEKEESKQRHEELMEQNKKLMTMLEQRLG